MKVSKFGALAHRWVGCRIRMRTDVGHIQLWNDEPMVRTLEPTVAPGKFVPLQRELRTAGLRDTYGACRLIPTKIER